jgi:hypothetical protein
MNPAILLRRALIIARCRGSIARLDYGVNDAHAPGLGVKQAGSGRDEYYYSASGTLKPLSQAHDTGMIWNKFNGRFGGGATQTEIFFIGSETIT